MMSQRIREGALSPASTPTTPPVVGRRVAIVTLKEFEELEGVVRWPWPWPCHREGHIFTVGDGRCARCRALRDWDDVDEIVATGKRKFRDRRREELPNYFTLPSGLLLDLG